LENYVARSVQTDSIDLSILLPVRNEGINLKIMLKILGAVVEEKHEVLVVYDHPDDNSIPVVKAIQPNYPNLHLVYNSFGSGVANAVKAGVHSSTGKYILIFAADEVGPVLAIEEMLQLMEQGCDFVSCTRYAHEGRRLGGSLIGGTLSRLANFLFNRFSGCVLTDATTGIKMFKKSVFEHFHLTPDSIGWVVAFEMAIKAQLLGLKLGEVPIISIDRLYGGESSFQLGPWFVEYLRWFIWGSTRLQRNRIKNKHNSVLILKSLAPPTR
jgi:dolichol-phosphate mannosyltransferase